MDPTTFSQLSLSGRSNPLASLDDFDLVQAYQDDKAERSRRTSVGQSQVSSTSQRELLRWSRKHVLFDIGRDSVTHAQLVHLGHHAGEVMVEAKFSAPEIYAAYLSQLLAGLAELVVFDHATFKVKVLQGQASAEFFEGLLRANSKLEYHVAVLRKLFGLSRIGVNTLDELVSEFITSLFELDDQLMVEQQAQLSHRTILQLTCIPTESIDALLNDPDSKKECLTYVLLLQALRFLQLSNLCEGNPLDFRIQSHKSQEKEITSVVDGEDASELQLSETARLALAVAAGERRAEGEVSEAGDNWSALAGHKASEPEVERGSKPAGSARNVSAVQAGLVSKAAGAKQTKASLEPGWVNPRRTEAVSASGMQEEVTARVAAVPKRLKKARGTKPAEAQKGTGGLKSAGDIIDTRLDRMKGDEASHHSWAEFSANQAEYRDSFQTPDGSEEEWGQSDESSYDRIDGTSHRSQIYQSPALLGPEDAGKSPGNFSHQTAINDRAISLVKALFRSPSYNTKLKPELTWDIYGNRKLVGHLALTIEYYLRPRSASVILSDYLRQRTSAVGNILLDYAGNTYQIRHLAILPKSDRHPDVTFVNIFNPDKDSLISYAFSFESQNNYMYPRSPEELRLFFSAMTDQASYPTRIRFKKDESGRTPTGVIGQYASALFRLIDTVFKTKGESKWYNHKHQISLWSLVLCFHTFQWMNAVTRCDLSLLISTFDRNWRPYHEEIEQSLHIMEDHEFVDHCRFLLFYCEDCGKIGHLDYLCPESVQATKRVIEADVLPVAEYDEKYKAWKLEAKEGVSAGKLTKSEFSKLTGQYYEGGPVPKPSIRQSHKRIVDFRHKQNQLPYFYVNKEEVVLLRTNKV